VVMLNYNQ